MLYLPENQDYAKKQQEYYPRQKHDMPKPERYGISVDYNSLLNMMQDNIPGYTKPPDPDYKRDFPVTDILPLLDSIVVREMPPGLRGYCFPALRVLYVRDGDSDPGRVNYHENKHIQIFSQDPNHSEWEIRRLENMRYGPEDN